MMNTLSAGEPSSGQWAGSAAWLKGRDSSNRRPQWLQRKSYRGTPRYYQAAVGWARAGGPI
jgi:hypothetical protein